MAQIPQPVLEVLGRAQTDGARLVLVGQLDRKLYVQVNDVLVAAGGKWDRKAKAHIFDGDAAEAIEPLILTGSYARTKHDFGQFDSPPPVVSQLIEIARVDRGMRVLEPSAGIGNLARAAAGNGASVYAIEIDEKRFQRLREDTAIASLQADFLQTTPAADLPSFDRVLMNPPFSKQADIDHVLHAASFLKPGGRLVSVMSAAVLFRENAKTLAFRQFVADRMGSFLPLPEGAFKVSGTAVNTCIVSFNT